MQFNCYHFHWSSFISCIIPTYLLWLWAGLGAIKMALNSKVGWMRRPTMLPIMANILVEGGASIFCSLYKIGRHYNNSTNHIAK